MTPSEVIAQTPAPFEYEGQTYQLGVADYDLELYVQARHEAWVRNRIEASAGQVSERAYRADCEVFATQRASNLFAFASPLSLAWLLSDEGMSDYVVLLSQKGKKEKGGAAFTQQQLRSMRKDDKPSWERLVRLVVGRDFPNVTLPEQAPATPPSTTSGSSNCSAENPSSRTEERSSGCPAATS